MIDILVNFTNEQPLRMLAWIGILYAFTGLYHQIYSNYKINFFQIIQIILLLIAIYINLNIEYKNTLKSIEIVKEHYGLKKNK